MKSLADLLSGYPSVFVVFDNNVASYAANLAGAVPRFGIDASEAGKTLRTVESVCRWLLESGADRDALLLAVGGGITTDTAGFAACIYKRGIRYANVPTTLLSQVDAAIGGKTGVNLDSYKNILGIIRQPEFTYIDSSALKTLPRREFLSGAAEMLKTFIIGDAVLYCRAVSLLKSVRPTYPEMTPQQSSELEFLISAAGAIKRRIVREDPYEKGLRRVLNLGHTYAHAVEWYEHSNAVESPMTHGEAVAVGIVRAAVVSEKLGFCAKDLSGRISRDFSACGLPVSLPCAPDRLTEALVKDKKAAGTSLRFVLVKDIGRVIVRNLNYSQI